MKLEEEKDGDHVARRTVAARHIANSKKINNKRDRIVIISQGPLPVILVTGSNKGDAPTVELVEIPKIDKSLIVDTNGAGDSLVGGFFAAYSAGKSIVDSIKVGIDLSGKVIQRSGC